MSSRSIPDASRDAGFYRDRSDLPPMPGLNKKEQQSAHWLGLFPNVTVSLFSSYITVMRVMPDGHGCTHETSDYFFHPSAQSDRDFEQKAAAQLHPPTK